MNIYACDEYICICYEYYMLVMNIIYAYDDICDLCEYLRLLEKKKKRKKSLPRAKATALGKGGAQHCVGYNSSPRAEDATLDEEPSFNESQIFGSQRRALLQRELPLLTAGRAVTVRGPSVRAKDVSRRISAERIQESSRRSPLHRRGFNVWPSPRASSRQSFQRVEKGFR
jgi:hypothetical protein